jgi:hypothetical protein
MNQRLKRRSRRLGGFLAAPSQLGRILAEQAGKTIREFERMLEAGIDPAMNRMGR